MAMDYIQANTDGRLHPANEPSISPLNRGFLYGDAIYEVWRTYRGTVFAFGEHWQRLERSAQALHINLPLDRDVLRTQIQRTAQEFFDKIGGRPELYIRLQITRGAGAIGLNTSLADQSNYVILVQPLKEPSEKGRRNGLRLSVAATMHRLHVDTVNPAWKTGNYLNSILCLREAEARGADEVVMTSLSGEITEASTSNLFFLRDQTLVTPPLSSGILEGITRRIVMEQARQRAGLEAREQIIRVEDLKTFQECFITSTTKEIAPVAGIDEAQFAVGKSSVTGRVQCAFNQFVQDYIERHPELKL